jgi:hypothetical protein
MTAPGTFSFRRPRTLLRELAASSSAARVSASSGVMRPASASPASVRRRLRVVRVRRGTSSRRSSRETVSLTVEGETPSRRAAVRNPPASATERKTDRSSREDCAALFDMTNRLFALTPVINRFPISHIGLERRPPMNDRCPAAAAGRFTFLGTSISVSRMGYGAMQLAGPHVFGEPADPDEARAVLRPTAEQISKLSPLVKTQIDKAILDDATREVLELYNSLGGNDKVAKGPDMKERLLFALAARYPEVEKT